MQKLINGIAGLSIVGLLSSCSSYMHADAPIWAGPTNGTSQNNEYFKYAASRVGYYQLRSTLIQVSSRPDGIPSEVSEVYKDETIISRADVCGNNEWASQVKNLTAVSASISTNMQRIDSAPSKDLIPLFFYSYDNTQTPVSCAVSGYTGRWSPPILADQNTSLHLFQGQTNVKRIAIAQLAAYGIEVAALASGAPVVSAAAMPVVNAAINAVDNQVNSNLAHANSFPDPQPLNLGPDGKSNLFIPLKFRNEQMFSTKEWLFGYLVISIEPVLTAFQNAPVQSNSKIPDFSTWEFNDTNIADQGLRARFGSLIQRAQIATTPDQYQQICYDAKAAFPELGGGDFIWIISEIFKRTSTDRFGIRPEYTWNNCTKPYMELAKLFKVNIPQPGSIGRGELLPKTKITAAGTTATMRINTALSLPSDQKQSLLAGIFAKTVIISNFSGENILKNNESYTSATNTEAAAILISLAPSAVGCTQPIDNVDIGYQGTLIVKRGDNLNKIYLDYQPAATPWGFSISRLGIDVLGSGELSAMRAAFSQDVSCQALLSQKVVALVH